MGNTDSIPVVSQAKSGVQLICGDVEGAGRTQKNFVRQCPVVSQVTSVVQLAAGDADGALETQKQCVKGLSNLADGIPVVGHAKGAIHYACGDMEGGHAAMKSATRTTGVLAGGAGGFVMGGPVGAVAGGIYGGAVTDVYTSAITKTPSGYVAAIDNAIHNPNPGDIFDLAMMPVADGLAGHGAGKVVQRLTNAGSVQANSNPTQTQLADAKSLKLQADALLQRAEDLSGTPGIPENTVLEMYKEAGAKHSQAVRLEGGVQMTEVQLYKQALKNRKMTQTAAANTSAGIALQDESKQKEQNRKKQRKVQQSVYGSRQSQQQQSSLRQARKSREPESSDSDSEDECICEDVKIPVLYANMRSVNPNNPSLVPKFERLKQLIQEKQPCIVAIVESWLKDTHDDEMVKARLGLEGWKIARQDRGAGHHPGNAYAHEGENNRRGGGVLLAWRCPPGLNFRVSRDPSEDHADNVVNFNIHVTFNCSKCNDGEKSKKFGFVVVYKPPSGCISDEIRGTLEDRLAHLPAWFTDVLGGYSGWCMVGDFNQDPRFMTWVTMFDESAEVVQNSQDGTHRSGNTLDYVIASGGLVSEIVHVSDQLISDHNALSFKLVVGEDYDSSRRCDPCSEGK